MPSRHAAWCGRFAAKQASGIRITSRLRLGGFDLKASGLC
jgi:hypothetical protein